MVSFLLFLSFFLCLSYNELENHSSTQLLAQRICPCGNILGFFFFPLNLMVANEKIFGTVNREARFL